jgi:uncharacterized protein YsxB (DUF464 family)
VIRARLVLDGGGRLLAFEASGHAGTGRAGADLACAAFSSLARTAWEALASIQDLGVTGKAEGAGDVSFKLGVIPDNRAERVRGMTDFLLTGLEGLERDFPGALALRVERERRDLDGS